MINQNTDMAILISMVASLMVLLLESIGNRQHKGLSIEKPHIRWLALSSLLGCLIYIIIGLWDEGLLMRRPLFYLNDISSAFLTINSAIAVLLGRKTLANHQNGENYFLILASLAISIGGICNSSLVIKIISITGWLVLMTTLSIRTNSGGKKVEIGLKMTIAVIFVMLQLFFAIALLMLADQPLDLELINTNNLSNKTLVLFAIAFVACSGLSLSATPPFHFAHIDMADGGNISVAYLLFSNSFIQAAMMMISAKNTFLHTGITIENKISLFGFMLLSGFMVLWLRALDQTKVRRAVAYMAASIGPLFCMSILFGSSMLMPQLIFILAVFSFLTLALFALFGSLAYMDEINQSWQTWEDMSGFGRLGPIQAITFMVAISSIAGLPGTLGYFIKLSLIAPFKDNLLFGGSIFLSIAIGAACTMRIFVFMFSKQPQMVRNNNNKNPPFSLVIASLILIFLGFFPFVR